MKIILPNMDFKKPKDAAAIAYYRKFKKDF